MYVHYIGGGFPSSLTLFLFLHRGCAPWQFWCPKDEAASRDNLYCCGVQTKVCASLRVRRLRTETGGPEKITRGICSAISLGARAGIRQTFPPLAPVLKSVVQGELLVKGRWYQGPFSPADDIGTCRAVCIALRLVDLTVVHNNFFGVSCLPAESGLERAS